MNKLNKLKEFLPSSWAVDHKTIIYLLMFIFFIIGLSAYVSMPRENFPEIDDKTIYISSLFPGNSSEDIERLITDPIEKEINNVNNIVEITSVSQEDYSIITVEYNELVTTESIKQKIQEEIDAVIASPNWPTFNGAKVEPRVFKLSLSEAIPILNINLIGDYSSLELKKYAEILQDEIENVTEIKEVTIRGLEDFEVEVAVDVYKMKAALISFDDIINAIGIENSTVSAGNIISNGERQTIQILGEIKSPKELENFAIKTEKGKVTYLRDIATITFKEKEKTSFSRYFQKRVVTLEAKKREGENLINAVEKIIQVVHKNQEQTLPKALEVSFSNDQSTISLNQVNDLVNNIIFGVILVVTVLMFFLGFRNALFVGFAIPMSMLISLMVLNYLGYTLNTMVLFGLVMGLGMLVDNGIVVVENIYRLIEKEGMSRIEATKKGIGEIAFPIIISTATTVAAFVPLGFWPGIMGEFMIFFPITLSVVLGSSLFVAIFFNSVLVSNFMKIDTNNPNIIKKKTAWILFIGLNILLTIAIVSRNNLFSAIVTLIFLSFIFFVSYKYFLKKWTLYFQKVLLVKLETKYKEFLKFALRDRNPYYFLIGTFFLLISSFIIMGISSPKVLFFPENDPNEINVYIEYPQGTDIAKTNNITKKIESDIYKVIRKPKYNEGKYNLMVESAIAQVGKGASNPFTDGGSESEFPHKGKVTLTMREFKLRKGISSENLRKDIQRTLKNKYPGILLSVEKDQVGPPVGYPINIEITGQDYGKLIQTAEKMKSYLDELNISGVEKLKIDVNKIKSKLEVTIDREKAGALGIKASQVGVQIRRSLFGEKAGVYKKNGDDYDINVRFRKEDKYNQNLLFNQSIIFRDPSNGRIKNVPISAITTKKNTNTFSAIKHRNLKRVVVLYSSVLVGFNPNEVVEKVKSELTDFQISENVSYKFTGEIEEQAETMGFLTTALLSALALILGLLVLQFNSISKPIVILLAVFLSFTGVLYGLVIFNMPFIILMTMMGIISLAGIVVNNGVVLLDYTQLLLDRKKEELEIPKEKMLHKDEALDVFVKGGTARLRPVLLTAITTILGLLPLAIGLNINFFSLLSKWNPDIYIGGDNVAFWGPLAWTVIFGLSFATFLTLVIVPSTYFIIYSIKLKYLKNKNNTI